MSKAIISFIDAATGAIETREMTDEEHAALLASLPDNPVIPGGESDD